MILECPKCRARYMVQIGLFAQGGRTVRCARCKHTWLATLPTTIDVFAPPPDLSAILASAPPTAMPGAAVPADENTVSAAHLPAVIKKRNWKKIGYVAAAIVVFFAVTAAWPILDRNQIVRVMPSLRDAYESLGLKIARDTNGLTFDQVKSELRYDGGTMHLYVDGIIHNTTADAQLIPDIKARALGPDQRVVQSWWVEAPAATIEAGADLPFHTEVNAPMQRTIENVYLEFYTKEEKLKDKPDSDQGNAG